MQGVAVRVDVAKDFHWVQAVDRGDSEIVERLDGLRERGRLTVGIDVVGDIASVLTAMLLDAGTRRPRSEADRNGAPRFRTKRTPPALRPTAWRGSRGAPALPGRCRPVIP